MKESELEHSTGLYCLSGQEWQKAVVLLQAFDTCMDTFLMCWTKRMKSAGYLDFTTARRKDCMMACHALLEPVLAHAKGNVFPRFEELRKNADGWANALVQSGLQHLKRGITGAMYLGCFKTFVFAMGDTLESVAEHIGQTNRDCIGFAQKVLAIYAHSFEVVWLETCENLSLRQQDLEQAVRLLTLEKCRFENIFNTTSDGVLVMDATCRIMTANKSLRQYLGENLEGKYVWEVLGIEGENAEDFFRYYPVGQTVEIMPFNEGLVFRLSIVSLGGISMAHHTEYLVVLTNITPHVLQREMLEAAIDKHAKDLCLKKQQVEDMNITLHNVLANIHNDKEKQQEALVERIRAFLTPALVQLAREPVDSVRESSAKLIAEQMENILESKGTQEFSNRKMRHLTLTEMKICNYIRMGKSTKEIARALQISVETVQTHRKNIRKKLGVSGHKTQLAMHLNDNSDQ